MKISALQDASGFVGTVFQDRTDAGERLAAALDRIQSENPIVLGLARGGVVVAAAVAKRLNAPLDALICQKVGAPNHPEYAVGAVAPGGIVVADNDALSQLEISKTEFERMAELKVAEVNRRLGVYRGGQQPPEVAGRTVVIVDDGLATGTTALAAVQYARKLGAARVVLAAPVCSSGAIDLLEDEVDELICLSEPSFFYAVGQWYRDFNQVGDDEVIALLSQNTLQ